MITPLVRLGLIIAALYVAGGVLPGLEFSSVPALVLMAVLLTVLGLVVRPVLVVLTLPLTVLTFGLFLLVLNALLFLLAQAMVPGVLVDGFVSAFLASTIVTLFRFVGKWKSL